jgi:hypothetical protein
LAGVLSGYYLLGAVVVTVYSETVVATVYSETVVATYASRHNFNALKVLTAHMQDLNFNALRGHLHQEGKHDS